VEWIAVAFTVGFISFLLWAFTGTYVTATLRAYWPELYALAGSPTAADFWWKRKFPNPFDTFTLTRRFRKVAIPNRDVVWQLELTCWLRWVQIVAACVFLFLLIASFGKHGEP
jgi:hypothetical protein